MAAAGSLAHAAPATFCAFARKYLRRRVSHQGSADPDADRFSSSAYRIIWMALMKASQPCS
jgi:hypothetical protein